MINSSAADSVGVHAVAINYSFAIAEIQINHYLQKFYDYFKKNWAIIVVSDYFQDSVNFNPFSDFKPLL